GEPVPVRKVLKAPVGYVPHRSRRVGDPELLGDGEKADHHLPHFQDQLAAPVAQLGGPEKRNPHSSSLPSDLKRGTAGATTPGSGTTRSTAAGSPGPSSGRRAPRRRRPG